MPDDYLRRSLLGGVAPRGRSNAAASRGPVAPARSSMGGVGRNPSSHGKRVVFVTPHAVAAKEEAEKYAKRGIKTEIKREKDDAGKAQFVVYVYE